MAFAPNAAAEAEPTAGPPAKASEAPGGGTAAAEQAPGSTAATQDEGGAGQAQGADGAATKDDAAKNDDTATGADKATDDKANGADKVSSEGGNGNANGTENGNGANAPGQEQGAKAEGDKQADKGGAVDQSAGASASADQKDTGNKHEDVRVDKPGNGAQVDQRNEATADAGASANADVPETTSVSQDVAADATAGQTGVDNTAVTVRVESPGENGGVTQANAATGSATAAAVGSEDGLAAADASATQDDVSNTNVSVRVFSPGDDGSVSQHNDATASSTASGGNASENASALQDDVRNTSVSIRVESPGASGEVSQDSSAQAAVSGRTKDDDESGGSSVAVTTNDVDTALSVVVQAPELDRPGTLQVWEWTWTWLRDEAQSLANTVEAALSSWTWNWDETTQNGPQGRGSVRSRAATTDEAQQAGTWNWSWDWQRSGLEAWSWQWDWSRTLQCGSCIWVWNWSWLWTGAPANASTADQSSDAPSSTPVQINSAQAEATTSVTATLEQTIDQDGEGAGIQYAGQLAEILQVGDAVSVAHQENVSSVSTGVTPPQANIVHTKAGTLLDAKAEQTATQVLGVDQPGAGDQWSGQQVEILQGGSSSADATQLDAHLTGSGKHEARADASASASAEITQDVVQDGLVGGGTLDQWAGQLTLAGQIAYASATTAQRGTRASRQGGGTAGASAAAIDLLFVDQIIGQGAVRVAGEGAQEAEQVAMVIQDAGAESTTIQRAGFAATAAQSEAIAHNRAAIVQTGAQVANGTSGFDFQTLTQRSMVLQEAYATSTSLGGLAGTATVVNCVVTGQGASQAIGATGAVRPGRDTTYFCWPPPAAPPTEPVAGAPSPTTAAVQPIAGTPPPIGRVPVAGSHVVFPADWARESAASPDARDRGTSTTPPPGLSAVSERPDGTPAALTQSPVQPSTQARIDTRPGSHAGDGDAGREPPLPPAGDPPTWISALAAAASSGGSSGIAAILLTFMLVPPVVRRAREGSVVRRPTTVFARAEVPV